jgi:hypothetical protein
VGDSVNLAFSIIQGGLNTARRQGLIPTNPAEAVTSLPLFGTSTLSKPDCFHKFVAAKHQPHNQESAQSINLVENTYSNQPRQKTIRFC